MNDFNLTPHERKMYRLGKLEKLYNANQAKLNAVDTGDPLKDLEEISKILSEQKKIAKKFLEITQELMPASFKTHRVLDKLGAEWGTK